MLIVLVKKKDGYWRFCVDYGKLDALTHRDAYPLPRIEESLTSLKQATWYSTLDLASRFWQVEVDPKYQEKTAFTSALGLYEFQRMPFGPEKTLKRTGLLLQPSSRYGHSLGL